MEQLLNASSQFPTVIFATLLGIVVIYWLVGLLGLIDLDLAPDADIDLDTDIDINASVGGLTGLLLTFGLTSVPFTLVISIVVLVSWLLSIYLQIYVLSLLNASWFYYLFGSLSTVIVLLISLPITAVLIRPLKGMFDSVEATSSHALVGCGAVVTTGKITENFGQAKLLNEGAEILVDVRCDCDNTLTINDKVLLIEYNKDKHSYIVAPFPEELL